MTNNRTVRSVPISTARRFVTPFNLMFGLSILLNSSTFAQTIYRCATPNGQPLFSNVPCNGASAQAWRSERGDSAANTSRADRIAQLRRIAENGLASSEQRAAAYDELNRYQHGDCRITDDEAFDRDKLYVALGEGGALHREQVRRKLGSLLNACFSGNRLAMQIPQPAATAALRGTSEGAPASEGKIYRCKTSQGAHFWASNWCSTAGGITVDVINVPAGMSFKEQAALADQWISSRSSSSSAEASARDRGIQCGAIDRELGEIRSRYDEGKYVPVDQVNRDQIRQRDLVARRGGLRCATR